MYCTFIKRRDNWRGILYLHTEENLNFSADRQYGILRVMLYKPLMYIYLNVYIYKTELCNNRKIRVGECVALL